MAAIGINAIDTQTPRETVKTFCRTLVEPMPIKHNQCHHGKTLDRCPRLQSDNNQENINLLNVLVIRSTKPISKDFASSTVNFFREASREAITFANSAMAS